MVLPFTYSAPCPICCDSCQISLCKQIFCLNSGVSRITGLHHASLCSLPHTFLAYLRKINSQILILWLQQVHVLVLVVDASWADAQLMWTSPSLLTLWKWCFLASAEDLVPVSGAVKWLAQEHRALASSLQAARDAKGCEQHGGAWWAASCPDLMGRWGIKPTCLMGGTPRW